jgi:hypothetical protein
MAGITSGGAEQLAFCLGSMAVASTRGEKWASSPLWPLAEVKRVGCHTLKFPISGCE